MLCFSVKLKHWWCYKLLIFASPYYQFFWWKGTRSHSWQNLCQKEKTGSEAKISVLKMQLGNITLIFSENFHIFVIL